MKTDTLFYQIFQTLPHLVFELLGRPVVAGYTFTSVEVKEKAFRFDGIFAPPPETVNHPIYFLEVQFQPDPNFYWEFISEICWYLNQQKPEQDWFAVAIFSSRAMDVKQLTPFQQDMVHLGRLVRIYLDELPDRSAPELRILRLITCRQEEAVRIVNEIRAETGTEVILKIIETILVYKFPKLRREEIERMFTLDDLRQTRFYQEAYQEGEALLLPRQISHKFGSLPTERIDHIKSLSTEQLETLGEALLDFTSVAELYQWLEDL